MARSRNTSSEPPQRLILDSGALISLARDEKRVNIYLQRALALEVSVEIPAVVVAETIRGGPKDASVHRILNMIGNVTPTTEKHGRVAGALLGKARSSSTIDALVVAHAVTGGGAIVLTGDTADLGRLAEPHPEVWIQSI